MELSGVTEHKKKRNRLRRRSDRKMEVVMHTMEQIEGVMKKTNEIMLQSVNTQLRGEDDDQEHVHWRRSQIQNNRRKIHRIGRKDCKNRSSWKLEQIQNCEYRWVSTVEDKTRTVDSSPAKHRTRKTWLTVKTPNWSRNVKRERVQQHRTHMPSCNSLTATKETSTSDQQVCKEKKCRRRKMKISPPVDVDQRFHRKKLRFIKYSLNKKHGIPSWKDHTHRTTKHVENMHQRITHVQQISGHWDGWGHEVWGPKGGAPKGGAPILEKWKGSPRVGPPAQNFALFFPLPPPCRSFCVYLGVFSWNFGGVWNPGGPEVGLAVFGVWAFWVQKMWPKH